MTNSSSASDDQVTEVMFTQQQYVIIEKLRSEGQFGRTDEEIVRRIFQEFLKQERL